MIRAHRKGQKMARPRLVVARKMPRDVEARIRRDFEAWFPAGPGIGPSSMGMVGAAKEHNADAVLIATNLKLSADVIEALPKSVRIVGSFGVGFDHVDVAAARKAGLIVTNTPEVLTGCTADLAFMLLLGACRRATEYGAIMREGWRRPVSDMLGIRVNGKTLGIVGMGRIGHAVAQRARGFDMKVIYTDAARLPPEKEQGATFFADLHEMLGAADIVSIHAPLMDATRKMMNAAAFAAMKPGAVFVNAARGGLVDEDALVAALQSGHLFAAGLDVFASEPDYDLRFRDLPNVFMTPHAGSATVETRNAMGFRVLDNIDAVLAGHPPIDPLWR